MKILLCVLLCTAFTTLNVRIALAQSGEGDRAWSTHFEIERVADGVWAAIASDSGYAISNAGIIDLGDRTLVYDPFLTPEAADHLRTAAETLTGHPISYVALSHWHNDHIRGAQSFPDAAVVGTSTTRRLIAEREPPEIEGEREVAPSRMQAVQARIDTASTVDRRREAIFWMAYYEGMLKSHDHLVLTLPEVTFDERLTIHGTERDVVLIELDGHTESDAVLWLPAERIAFMGDLLFVERHPYLPNGDPDKHRAALRAAVELNPDRVVPGHGPIRGTESIHAMIRYIDDMEAHGRALAASGATDQEARAAQMPPPYRSWWFGNFVPVNTLMMTQRARQASAR